MLSVSCTSTLLRLLHEIDVSLLLSIVAEAYRVARLQNNFTASTLEIARLGAGTVGMGCRLHLLRDLRAHGMRTRGQSHSLVATEAGPI